MIREATIDDIPDLLRTVKSTRDNLDTFRPEASDEELIRYIVFLIELPQGLILIAEEEGKTVGSFGGEINKMPGSSKLVFTEKWFYVEPEYRVKGVGEKLFVAEKLFKTVEELAILAGIDLFIICIVRSDISEALGRACSRRGFKQAETIYIKEMLDE